MGGKGDKGGRRNERGGGGWEGRETKEGGGMREEVEDEGREEEGMFLWLRLMRLRSEEVRGQKGYPLPVTLCLKQHHIWLLLARVGEDIATVT